MSPYRMVQGLDWAQDFQIFQADGFTPRADLLPTDTLSARLWPGDDLPSYFAPAVAWVDSAVARFRVAITDTQSAVLEPGTYRLQILLARGDDQYLALDSKIDVGGAPGIGVAAPVYCTFDDMLDHAPWVADLQSVHDQTGFREQRARARTWLEDVILGSYRPDALASGKNAHLGWTVWGQGGSYGPSKWLQDQLTANLLMIRPKVVEMTARKAIALVCEVQLGGPTEETSYQALAQRYHARAEGLAASYLAEIDLNADGYADVVVPCGLTSTR